MKQRLGSTRLGDGTEIAYALVGEGPLLVHAPGWLTHLEASWAMPIERRFYEMLAEGRTLVRYDKPNCGLSGTTAAPPSLALEVETLAAVVDAVTREPVDVFGASLGACAAAAYAAEHPVKRLVLYGGWVRGRDIAAPEIREHVIGLIGANWGLGSDVLAEIFAPGTDAATRAAFKDYQQQATSAGTAKSMLAAAYALDISGLLPRITAPTLVLHRDRDRAAPLEQGRALASAVPDADFVVLPGRDHLPYSGDALALVGSIRRFLGLKPPRRPKDSLTPRQQEVAALVARGLTNREIAAELTITERSAESHVERIRDRLGFRSRAQLAVWFSAGGR